MRTYFSHDRPRKGQDGFMADVMRCLDSRRHLIAHAPTGIGKTGGVLGPALTYALDHGKTVFFLTPKISQHRIAMDELQRLEDKYSLGLKAVDIVGRKHMCVDPVLKDSGHEDFYAICQRRRKDKACPYHNFAKQAADQAANLAAVTKQCGGVCSHEAIIETCARFKKDGRIKPLCAYEVALQLAKDAQVVVCDYSHLFVASISGPFLKQIDKQPSESIIIIDEAHNLPDRMRDSMSATMSTLLLKRAEKEAESVGEPELAEAIHRLHDAVELLATRCVKKECKIRKEDVPRLPEDSLKLLAEAGLRYLQDAGKQKSACLRLVEFLQHWEDDSPFFLRMLRKRDENIAVLHNCLDPAMATSVMVNEAHSVIAMSGTLTPQTMYKDLLGFDPARTELKEYASPFPPENRLNVVCDTVTTKFESRSEETYSKMASECARIVNTVPGNTALFFPSYQMMRNVLYYFEPQCARPILTQKQESTPEETATLLQKFRGHAAGFGAVLTGVAGGSLAEGMDFPGRELMAVVVVGVPFKEYDLESQAVIEYYEFKFGAGWNYGYLFPAMTKAVQAAGRCIRNETDRGTIVFMDSRFATKQYSSCFPKDLQLQISDQPSELVKRFWDS